VFANNEANMSIHDDEPLVVRPKKAAWLLSVGETRLYEMIAKGELESFRDGGARKITTRSIRDWIERQLERAKAA
jgi:excisionase family DNA binding protein